MRGRVPKGAAERKLQGNTRRQKKVAEKVFFAAAPAPVDAWGAPAWLTEGARRIWGEILPVVRRETKLQESQLQIFAAYCDALDRLQRFTKELVGNEVYVTDRGFRRPSPYVALRDAAANAVRQLAAELTLTPKAWASSMGTFVGRQLDLFAHGGSPPPPTSEAKPADGESSFFTGPPTLQ